MTTTPVSPGNGNSPDNNATVTSGNTLDVQSGGVANNTTVNSGGTLEVDAGGSETDATVQAGGTDTLTGTINGSNVVTSAATSTGDLDYGTINVSSGGSVGGVTVENGGLLELTLKSAAVNGATVLAGGSLTINGNAPANNVTLQGGTLELISAKADTANTTTGQPSASGTLTFATGSSSRLQIDAAQTGTNGTTFAQTITGFASGDVIDLESITGGTITTAANGSNTNVTVTGTGGSETFTFVGAAPAGLTTQADPNTAGTDLVVCYCAGTLIRVERGGLVADVAVEDLVVGDLVVTASGARRPIRWLGHRGVDCRHHPRPHEVRPVRIAAHAFGPNRPARDLRVSPGHALCLDLLGEVLIPASALVNGTTISQEDVDAVAYWHVELDSHDIILAENLPCESYLDMGNRPFFAEAEVVDLDASPDAAASARTHADFCRPFHGEGPLVEVVRSQLRARALRLDWSLDTSDAFADLHLLVDGARVEPAKRGPVARFHVPAGAEDVWLVSATSRPCEVATGGDARDLGVCVGGLTIEDGFAPSRAIDLADPLLCAGLHHLEDGARRWTAGRTLLPHALWAGQQGAADHGFFLRVELAGPALPRWIGPVGRKPAVGAPAVRVPTAVAARA